MWQPNGFFVLCLLAGSAFAGDTILKKDTVITLELRQHVSTKLGIRDTRIPLRVVGDIVVDGRTVIAAGAKAFGQLARTGEYVEEDQWTGLGRKHGFRVSQVTAVDGSLVYIADGVVPLSDADNFELKYNNASEQAAGAEDDTAKRQWPSHWKRPPGAAMRGEYYEVKILRDARIGDPVKPKTVSKPEVPTHRIEGSLAKRRFNVNLVMGRQGSKIIVQLREPVMEVRLLKINDELLPKPISAGRGSNKDGFARYFLPWWPVVRRGVSGENILGMHAILKDGSVAALDIPFILKVDKSMRFFRPWAVKEKKVHKKQTPKATERPRKVYRSSKQPTTKKPPQ